ncbi:hypothetical protein DAPPUDRAFT_263048 [Daphnia pulex]|uniref:Uncharacterized protein n=1 Tax=Daphnia pulex TaxID=6669 RepID=E9HP01_DAPPU|nr:hypothetical protein DAPPUDRAFT_263048 [Daphnia pulex]|eukprot:EFX66532.1 hypothetical protein DAPPUDRAFT_263048 [Daphnia pulex]
MNSDATTKAPDRIGKLLGKRKSARPESHSRTKMILDTRNPEMIMFHRYVTLAANMLPRESGIPVSAALPCFSEQESGNSIETISLLRLQYREEGGSSRDCLIWLFY